MTLGQRIQQIRTSHALSQKAFGAKLGTTRQTVSKWELDQTIPEIQKIVMMSKLFSVTTDSLLVDGISTFDCPLEQFICGVYRSSNCELVETEKFALLYYYDESARILGTKLYKGLNEHKKCIAACEYGRGHNINDLIRYTFQTSDGTVCSNSPEQESILGEVFDRTRSKSMKRLENFLVDHDNQKLPTVNEVGIKNCLQSWRMYDSFEADATMFRFYLNTGITEYIFQILPENTNIYCGASYNIPFDMGLFSGGQFFRIRTFADNTEHWCGYNCDFSYQSKEIPIPTEECKFGECVSTSKGLMWCVKRYTNDEIVLQGCGCDEYIYRKDEKRTESFVREP